MSYATLSDLQNAFSADEILQLADRDGYGTPDAGLIALVQNRAQSMIDGYLAGHYQLPLVAPYPPVIIGIDCDLERYFLSDNMASQRVADAYAQAVSWLKDVSAGRVLLQLPAATSGAVTGGVAFVGNDRVFSHDNLSAW